MSQSRSALSDAAFQAVVDAAPEGILVVQGQVVFASSKTEKLFAYQPGEMLGQPIEALVPEFSREHLMQQNVSSSSGPGSEPPENIALQLRALRKDGTNFQVNVSCSPVETEGGKFVCCVIRKATRGELLESLLRICSSCKKVRDENGAWGEIETFLLNHSNLKFSHGICADCAQRLYPDHFNK
jgi:PAS domain S-box-containing protein